MLNEKDSPPPVIKKDEPFEELIFRQVFFSNNNNNASNKRVNEIFSPPESIPTHRSAEFNVPDERSQLKTPLDESASKVKTSINIFTPTQDSTQQKRVEPQKYFIKKMYIDSVAALFYGLNCSPVHLSMFIMSFVVEKPHHTMLLLGPLYECES